MKICILYSLALSLLFAACSSPGNRQNLGTRDSQNDTLSPIALKTDFRFVVPSPGQTAILLQNCPMPFNPSALTPLTTLKKYNTSFDKSLLLGIYGADLCYLGLFEQKELLSKYFTQVTGLLKELEIDLPEDGKIVDQMELSLGNSKQMYTSLNEMFRQSNLYLVNNERRDVCALIVAGGWIESFFILNKLQSINPGTKCLTELIEYQNYILEHLIKILAPFYDVSPDYSLLIDHLVKIAEEFDLMDTETETTLVKTDSIRKFSYIQNSTSFSFTGSKPDSLYHYILELRTNIIR